MQRDAEELLAALSGDLSVVDRAQAGRCLAELGDPRPEIMVAGRMLFCRIPAGTFLRGCSPDDSLGREREKPLREVLLEYDFWLAKHPVSVAQYRAFSAATARGRSPSTASGYAENFPVAHISMDDALAFCEWVSGQLVAASPISPANEALAPWSRALAAGILRTSLPSEDEWEKAARGPTAAWMYPWGAGADANKANYQESGLGTYCSLGCFPLGESPFGVADLSGNVWERCRGSLVVEGVRCAPLRGGAFSSTARHVRCAYRNLSYREHGRSRTVGFRLALVPALYLDSEASKPTRQRVGERT